VITIETDPFRVAIVEVVVHLSDVPALVPEPCSVVVLQDLRLDLLLVNFIVDRLHKDHLVACYKKFGVKD